MDLDEMANMLRIAQRCNESELLVLEPLFKVVLKQQLTGIPPDQWIPATPIPLRRFLPEQPIKATT